MIKVTGQGTDRFAVVCFKKAEDVEKALEVYKVNIHFQNFLYHVLIHASQLTFLQSVDITLNSCRHHNR